MYCRSSIRFGRTETFPSKYQHLVKPDPQLQYLYSNYYTQRIGDPGIDIESGVPTQLRLREPDPRVLAYGTAPALDTSDLRGIVRFRAVNQAVIAEIDSRSWSSLTDRGQHILTFTKLGVFDALERLSWTDTKFIPSEAERAELTALTNSLDPRDLVFCRERADLALRETVRVHK